MSWTAVAPVPMIPTGGFEVVVVVPGGGVDDLALEPADARDVRGVRLGQEAGGGDQVAGAQRLAAGQR